MDTGGLSRNAAILSLVLGLLVEVKSSGICQNASAELCEICIREKQTDFSFNRLRTYCGNLGPGKSGFERNGTLDRRCCFDTSHSCELLG